MNRREISPALAGSVALHAAVAAALLISWPWSKDLKIGSAVPVTIVANAPAAELNTAIEAPTAQTAQAEEPTPEAPLDFTPPTPQPQPAPPAPQPAPAKSAPAPQPKPTPTPAAKAPAAKPPPPKPAPKADPGLDLDALAASVSKMAKPSGARPSSAPKGAARPETAQQARTGQGSASASSGGVQGLVEELQRRWNPNCNVQGGRDVLVRATFQIGSSGQLVGDVATEIKSARSSVAEAAALRAASAVRAAAPFRSLPREYYGQRIGVNFNAREACS